MILVKPKCGKILWLVGHRGAGKSTLCAAVSESLEQQGKPVQVLDGDVLRRGLCSDLGFSAEDRSGEDSLGDPRQEMKDASSCLRREGWKIIVQPSRRSSIVELYLRREQIPFDEINANTDYPGLSPKPVATVYWDDRAACYSGDGMSDLQHIRQFRTYCQRE